MFQKVTAAYKKSAMPTSTIYTAKHQAGRESPPDIRGLPENPQRPPPSKTPKNPNLVLDFPIESGLMGIIMKSKYFKNRRMAEESSLLPKAIFIPVNLNMGNPVAWES
jgi:hypothetical protein